MTRAEQIEYLMQNLAPEDMYGQLAEESCELAQAALKMQRDCIGRNPPRKSPDDCYSDLVEEIADVMLCLLILGEDWNDELCQEIENVKLERWVNHIKATKEH